MAAHSRPASRRLGTHDGPSEKQNESRNKMCDKESFAKIRDAIGDLQKADAVQSEQIKTLFRTTEK